MPTYDFACSKKSAPCPDWHEHVDLEFFDTPVACPSCGSIGKRIPSLSNFVLAGGGWAKDGYSKGKPVGTGNGT